MVGILQRVLWPFRKLSQEVRDEVAEKAALAARVALAEAPLLDDLLDGKEVVVELRVTLKRAPKKFETPGAS